MLKALLLPFIMFFSSSDVFEVCRTFDTVMMFDICDVYFWGGGDCVVKDDWIVHHGPLPM